MLVTKGCVPGSHPGGVWLSQTLKGTDPPEKVTMPCVWLFAAVVLGEYEKDTVNAAAVSRPADWIEGGVPTPTPRTRTTKSPTVKRARRRMIRPAVCPVFELYAEVRRADNDTGLSSRIFNPAVRDERFT